MRKALLLVALILALLAPSTSDAHAAHRKSPPVLASQGLISSALNERADAREALERLNLVRRALLLPVRRGEFVRPSLHTYAYVWGRSAALWRAKARQWRDERAALWRRLTQPPGTGAERWRPLVRFYWPAHLVDKAVWVIGRESGGWPGIRNGSSGAAGLFQLLPAPAGWWKPAINVWYAYRHKYLPAGGWSPWRACGA